LKSFKAKLVVSESELFVHERRFCDRQKKGKMEEEVTSSFPVLTTSDAIVLVNDFGITAELHAIQVSLTTRHFA
jgi:hypothetical protein